MRTIISLNKNWKFTKEGEQAAETVALPHTWNAKDGQDGVEMYRGLCVYERGLTLTEEDVRCPLFLEIGAASLTSRVLVNGREAAENECPFSMYRVRLNEYVHSGENQIRVEVDNTEKTHVYPRMADFSFYGGLYRYVALVRDEEVHFDELDKSLHGVWYSQKKEESGAWSVDVQADVVAEGERRPIVFSAELLDQEGSRKASAETQISPEDGLLAKLHLEAVDVHLWQGTEDPYLYTLVCRLSSGEKVYDERTLELGFREIEITPDKGLFLNGKHLKLRGVARHQDFGGVGNAIGKAQMDRDMELIKELGANSVRLSHYQHDDYFYSLCDRNGILAWAEVPFISILSTDPKAVENIRLQMEYLVKQCRQHTSIYCWGVQNEITIAGETEETYQLVGQMEEYTKSLDPQRYTAQANVYSVPNTSPLNEIADLLGYNLYYGWYYKSIEDLQVRLDEFHAQRPNIPLMVTEYGVDTNPKFHSYEPKVKDYTEEYQLLFSDNAIRAFEERDFMVGSYVWNFADFGSAAREEGGRMGQNQKGLVTIDRELKKDAFYLYKAYWSKEKFVYLASRRFVNRHLEENDIIILSNLESLTLYVNGVQAAKAEQVLPLTRFQGIRLDFGENEVAAEGTDKDGNIYRDSIVLVRVEEPDSSYILPQQSGGNVKNWFEGIDLSGADEIGEIELDDACYSTRDKMGDLLKNEQTKAVVMKYFGKFSTNPRFAMMEMMTIDAMAKVKNLGIPDGLTAILNKELNQIKK